MGKGKFDINVEENKEIKESENILKYTNKKNFFVKKNKGIHLISINKTHKKRSGYIHFLLRKKQWNFYFRLFKSQVQ